VEQIGLPELTKFAGQWKDGALSASKKLERLWTFFDFAQKCGYIKQNPVDAYPRPPVAKTIKEPFTDKEMAAIMDALYVYPDVYGKLDGANAERLRAMTLLLRYSGLRIGDAIMLRRDRLSGRRLHVHTKKTGEEVFVPLPQFVADSLQSMPATYRGKHGASHPQYFFLDRERYVEKPR
jgi:integrase